MASHHFIGKGLASATLREAADDSTSLLATVEQMVLDSRLSVVARQVAEFPQGDMTLVWVLAESHLVIHYWAAEGFTTIDLHVCDYGESNAGKAEALKMNLEGYCFQPGSAKWKTLSVADPPSAGQLVG